ncbi:uncharacterized protein ALTATR162_LOCUS4623 [Alternaria atra]|uniref:Uncharacterized protein n=1 Tax=Alternaria atra TaxID=119953 RepID=A0A8J2I6A0_9PLEO|nr:uncharacterized protein ALTATR162_LOCUS4623 [Alternaria atra]CAG5156830.1 unnamed protein product [Alternaria atra]
MSLVTLSSLPDPILHLICIYLTPDRPTVNDDEQGQCPTLYRPIISLSLTAHSLNCISSKHIATNISLTDACARWDLFLRTVTTNPTYASNVKYLKLNESSVEEPSGKPLSKSQGEHIVDMFRALNSLEALHLHYDTPAYADLIVHCLTYKSLPLWDTLRVVRFDNINAWDEECIVQLDLEREERGEKEGTGGKYTSGTERLNGELEGLNITRFLNVPDVTGVSITTRDVENDGDDKDDADWVDGDEEEEVDEDSDGWSERDYEDDSEDSDWDSEDESDYEDDWEAEYGFSVPKAEPTKDLPVPNTAVVVPGKSLLDF